MTGGARGIGRAIVERLAIDGAAVVVADIDVAEAEKVTSLLLGKGLRAYSFEVDVTKPDRVQAMTQWVVRELGALDILVNSAGILGPEKPVKDLTWEEWSLVLKVNLTGTFLCCQAAIREMLKRGTGRIVNVASVAGKEGNPNLAAYSASKAAVICLTKSLAKEVAKSGITVNSVSPTMIETDLVKGMSQAQFELLLSKIPVGRIGKPEEVAALVRFLVSPEAAFITGQCYDISGGRSVY